MASRIMAVAAGCAMVIGMAAAPTVATADDEVRVSVNKDIDADSVEISGRVRGGPERGMVTLQRKNAKGRWKSVTSSDFNPAGYHLTYPDHPGTYRLRVSLRDWHQERKGPRAAFSRQFRVSPGVADGLPVSRKWVVGLGDSYMSGEGASYAGYGPKGGNDHWWWTTSDRWWINAFGSGLKQTFAGDYEQPLAQPALADLNANERAEYAIELSGNLCHRSPSALMFWNRPEYPAMNLACSGAVVDTAPNTRKPGVDFYQDGDLVGQAVMLQRFAEKVVDQGDTIKVISLSIGGNDIGFADIIADCVERYLTPTKSACWKPGSGSVARDRYDGGEGLVKARAAVVKAGNNIIEALDKAGIEPGSYTIAVQTYPIGLPPANQFEKDFGGDSGYGRQGIGGCGFTDGDLDFFNGDFGRLLEKRTIEGARQLSDDNPQAKVTVVDASAAVRDHQLCSNRVSYPKTSSNGDNTLTPAWDGAFGGRRGSWITPIIIQCMGSDDWKTCYESDNPATLYPTLWRTVDGSGAYRSKPWYEAIDNLKQLPAHPNYWGQRALASCHSQVATDPDAVGKVNRCVPQDGSLDTFGRPPMKVTVDGPLG